LTRLNTGRFVAALALALFATPALAQVDTGTILGTVRDSTGAVLPTAKVTIVHEGQSITLSTETRDDGTFIFTPIRTGTYRVEVESPGFKKAVRRGIELNIQQQARVDLTLEPGGIEEEVEVSAAAPLLQTQSGSVGETLTSDTISSLPIAGRDYTSLARLTAGVAPPQPGARAPLQFAANGTRPAQNNYLLDGIDNNTSNVDFLSGVAYIVKPPVDAVGEVKVLTSSFSAEYGRAGGAVLNATLKSGSNEFHGSAWEFHRNDRLDAEQYFAKAQGLPKGDFSFNQFGFTAGGPLVKGKTFWFADYEGTLVREARTWTTSVPTKRQRDSGFTDFSDLLSGQGGTVGPDLLGRSFPRGTIFDPATTRRVVAGQVDPVTGRVATGTGFVRDPFPGNIVPAGRLNPNAVRLMRLYPEPTLDGLFNNYATNRNNKDDTHAFDVRIDHHFSNRDSVFARYSFADTKRFKPGPFDGFADGGGFGEGDETVRVHGLAVSHTHMFSSTLINEARFGFSREHTYRVQAFGDDTSDIPGQFGIQGIPQLKGNGGLPTIHVGGLTRLGSSDWLVSERFSNTTQFTENLTKIYKSHAFKGGFMVQHISFPWTAPPWSRGSLDFGGQFTSIPNRNDSSTGRVQFLLQPVAARVPGGVDMLGGASGVNASPFGGVDNYKDYFGAYLQDSWRVSSSLTLNLGVRWDYFGLVGEDEWEQANFVPGPPGARAQYIIPARHRNRTLSPSFLQALERDGIELVYSDEFGSGLGRPQKTNLAPRVDFAWQPTPKLVARGGYGIYYGAFENRGGFPNLGYNYPFQFDFSFQRPDDATPVRYPDGSLATLERGLAGVPLDPQFVSGAGLNLRGIEFAYKTPYVQSFNLMLQYELGRNHSVEAGYVGSLGRHIETFSGTNNVTRVLPPGTNPTPYVRFPSFARGSSYATTNGVSSYHSLQTKFLRRMHKGLDFLLAYTLSEAKTNAGDLLSGGGVGGLRAPDIEGFGIGRDVGLSAFHVKHALVFSGTYELPFKGPFLGGWSTNWIFSAYSGQPQTIGCTIATTSGAGCYALLVPGQDPYAGRHNVEQFYNPDAFQDPPVATAIGQTDFSPLGGTRSQVTGPPFRQIDLSLVKQVRLKADRRLEFRVEAFNLTNTPSFNLPGSLNFNDKVNFARITSTRNSARQIQLGLKFYW
jgi:hypothetical protein